MDTLNYELTDRANSLAKYDFFLKNMGVEKSLEELAGQAISEKGKARVFDIGCGEGGALKELKKLFGQKVTVCGIDALPVMGLDGFVLGDAAKEEFPANCDLVVSFRALHEIAQLKKVFGKVVRALCAGGQAFLSIRCQQLVGKKVFFHGNLKETDLAFLREIERKKEFGGARVLVLEIKQKGLKGNDFTAGVNVLLAKGLI